MLLKTVARVVVACPALLSAAIVGTNPPSSPLSAERIAQLPAAAQPEWRDYLARSTALRAVQVRRRAITRRSPADR